MFFKGGKQAFHPFGEGRPAQQAVEGDHQLVDIHHAAAQRTQVTVLLHLGNVAQERDTAPSSTSRTGRVFRAFSSRSIRSTHCWECWMISSTESAGCSRGWLSATRRGMVIAKGIHGTRAQPPHQAQETVLLADLRRPAVQVAAEGHAGRPAAGSSARTALPPRTGAARQCAHRNPPTPWHGGRAGHSG